jgi:hypothetical protein
MSPTIAAVACPELTKFWKKDCTYSMAVGSGVVERKRCATNIELCGYMLNLKYL